VIELKKGKASDSVVGQVQRYMGYVKDELVEKNQRVSMVSFVARQRTGLCCTKHRSN
jgi:hypothetical protein